MSCFLRTLLAASAFFLLSGPAWADEDPGDLFRQSEWRSHTLRIQQDSRAAEKIPFHQPVYDVTFYDIDVRLDPSDETLVGSVMIEAVSLVDTLARMNLDLVPSLTVDSITGNSSSFTHPESLITIELDRTYMAGESFAVRVHYHGEPKPAFGLGLHWQTHQGEPIVFSFVEPFFSNNWWPCKDVPWDKADSAAVSITVPEGMIGVSNGVLLDTDSTSIPGWRTYHWKTRHPIPPYLISVAASNYVVLEDTYTNMAGVDVPIFNYVFPEAAEVSESTFSRLPDMMAHQESAFGAFPFSDEKYGHAVVRGAGAMEHNTATSWGNLLVADNHGFDDIVAHELAHQWWGDEVTCADWHDLWLNEGFATYTEGLWREHRNGPDALSRFMARLERDASTIGLSAYVHRIPDGDTLFSSAYFDAVYDGGAWAMHMLRRAVGDDGFFNCLARHRADGLARGGIASTEQFRASCEAATGIDLEQFFAQWVYGVGAPHFIVHPFIHESGESLWVRFEQSSQAGSLFVAPIDITFLFADGGDTTITVTTSGAVTDTFLIVPGGSARDIQFDKDEWLLDSGFDSPLDDKLMIDETMGAELSWDIDDDILTGVNLYRGPTPDGPWEKLNDDVLSLTDDWNDESNYINRFYRLGGISSARPGYETTLSTEIAAILGNESVLQISSGASAVSLAWAIDESYVTGVNLYRAPSMAGPWEKLNDTPLPLNHTREDGIGSRERFYYIEAVSSSDPEYKSQPSNVVTGRPVSFAILNPDEYHLGTPNPYIAGSGEPFVIQFNVPDKGISGKSTVSPSHITIGIYDIAGRLVREVLSDYVDAGFSRTIEWDGENDAGNEVSAGIYFIHLESGGTELSRKVVVIR